MVDMRKRFRGNQPVAVSLELEGEKGAQLYGGGPAVGGWRGTEGREDENEKEKGGE